MMIFRDEQQLKFHYNLLVLDNLLQIFREWIPLYVVTKRIIYIKDKSKAENIVFVKMSFHWLSMDLLEEVNMRYLDKHQKAVFQA